MSRKALTVTWLLAMVFSSVNARHPPVKRQATPSPSICSSNPWAKSELIPDVIDAPPLSTLQVKFGTLDVDIGNILTPTDVRLPPTHLSWDADDEALYTLIVTDPDAPSRQEPSFREFLHWIVGNMPCCDPTAGETIADYIPAGPPQGTGLHRYAILVYRQSGQTTFDEARLNSTSFAGRPLFKTRDFVNKYGLELVAGSFYEAEYDSAVDDLMKTITDK